MGSFYTKARVHNIVDRGQSAEIGKLLVDTGSEYTWVPAPILEQLGIQQEKKDLLFVMANGVQISRSVGFAIIDVEDKFTIDEVVFAEEGDLLLLGARTLEGLNLTVDSRLKKLVASGPLPAALVLILSGAVMAEDDAERKAAEEKQARLLEQVCTQLETGDSFQAAEFIESQGQPLEVAGLYSNLLRGLYFKKKNVPRMILIGRAGIRYCLQHAQAAAKDESNSDVAKKLKGMAKTIAFNLSANTWPAWEDEGIVVTRTDQLVGLDAARLNLRLARELDRSADKVANAFWLLGAHHLALGKYDTAAKQFEQAAQKSAEAKTPDAEQMARGYIAITRLAADKTDSAAEKQLDESIEKLKGLNTEDARFFADQLKSVNAFFMR